MSGAIKLLSVEEVCNYLGVSRYFVYDQVRLGALPCARIARQLRFRPADIESFIDGRLLTSAAPLRAIAPERSSRSSVG